MFYFDPCSKLGSRLVYICGVARNYDHPVGICDCPEEVVETWSNWMMMGHCEFLEETIDSQGGL